LRFPASVPVLNERRPGLAAVTHTEKIYPAIIWRSRVYDNTGQACVRVEIEYGGDTPHFSGPALVRRGSETVRASDEVFQRLVDFRKSKTRELASGSGRW
jgi:hypothetical protein